MYSICVISVSKLQRCKYTTNILYRQVKKKLKAISATENHHYLSPNKTAILRITNSILPLQEKEENRKEREIAL